MDTQLHNRGRMKLWTAITSMLMIALLLPLDAFAQQTHYIDVPLGAYYEDAVKALLKSNGLDSNETYLRPADAATRAEVMKLLVNVYGATMVNPSTGSFSDVPKAAWYYPYIETAASEGWLMGDGDCYGTAPSRCTARPGATVNRAEMAIILKRAFRLKRLSLAPLFSDNRDTSMWYFDPIQTAADHCILQGDDRTGLVRPGTTMNRAEMVVMFHRAQQYLRYGQDCATPEGKIIGVSVTDSSMLNVNFNNDLEPNMIGQTARYRVEDTSNTSIAITSTSVVNGRSVNIRLASPLASNRAYRLIVSNMKTENGATFSDTFSFQSGVADITRIDSVTARSARVIRLNFTSDVDATMASNTSKYLVQGNTMSGAIDVISAVRIDARTVDLTLRSDLGSSLSYQVYVVNMQSATNQTFSDNRSFTSLSEAHRITNVSVESPTRVRVSFSTTLNEGRAEQTIRYTISSGNKTISISTADLMPNSTSVELMLAESLKAQTAYTLFVSDLLTANGTQFGDNVAFVYGSGSTVSLKAMLRGLNEVPSVATAATGTGVFVLTSSGLQYDISYANLSSSFSAAHFHRGAAGVSGPVLKEISFSGTRATGTWTNLTNEERNTILSGEVYVNIHSANHADGEIRGQMIVQ